MRVLLLVTSLQGGAGGSARKLYERLPHEGVDARVLVRSGSDEGNGIVQVGAPFPVRLANKVAWRRGIFEHGVSRFVMHRLRQSIPHPWRVALKRLLAVTSFRSQGCAARRTPVTSKESFLLSAKGRMGDRRCQTGITTKLD